MRSRTRFGGNRRIDCARLEGHDPAVVLRVYAKAVPQDNVDAAKIRGNVLKGVL
jgi:hypothetical protein